MIAFNRDGSALVQAEMTGRLRAMKLDGSQFGTPRVGHATEVRAATWLRHRDLVASLDTNGELRIFSAPGSPEARQLAGHDSYVYGAAFSPDGSHIASCGWDHAARIWDSATGERLQTVTLPHEDGRTICWMRDGARFVTGAGDTATAWTVTGTELARLDTGSSVRCVVPGRGDDEVLVAEESGRLESWDVATGRHAVVADLKGRSDARVAIAPARDAAAFAVGARLDVVDLVTGKSRWRAAIPGESFVRVAFDGRGTIVIAATLGGHVASWDAATGRLRWRLRVPAEAKIFGLAVHPSEPLFVTGTHDGRITTWDLEHGEMITRLVGHSDYVYDLAFSRDGERLVSASGDGTVRVWDTRPVAERLAHR